MNKINKKLIAHLSAILLAISLITGQVLPALAAVDPADEVVTTDGSAQIEEGESEEESEEESSEEESSSEEATVVEEENADKESDETAEVSEEETETESDKTAETEPLKVAEPAAVKSIAPVVETVTARALGASSSDVYYNIEKDIDENVKLSGSGNKASLKGGNRYYSITIAPVDPKTHYIDKDSIYITPEENVEDVGSPYELSGGKFSLEFSGIKGDITIHARAVEKTIPTAITVESVSFNKDGIYSEENPGIQVEISAKVVDQNGNTVPKTKVYFKDDESEVSYTQARETGEDGIAVFKYSYVINRENGDTTADYKPVFALDNKFTEAVSSTEIHLVLQLKKDLILYEDQITGTYPGDNKGKVTGVPDDYELWSGDVHQGALVTGDGAHWISPVNGEFTGLRSGQQALRIGEKVDGNTFYFASDYNYFFVPRLLNRPEENKEQTSQDESDTPTSDIKPQVKPTDDKPSSDPGTATDDTYSDGSDTDSDDEDDSFSFNPPTAVASVPASYFAQPLPVTNTTRLTSVTTGQNDAAEVAEATQDDEEDSEPVINVTQQNGTVAQSKNIAENAVPLAGSIDQTQKNSPDAIILYTGLLILLGAVILYGIYRYNKRQEAE